MLPGDLSLFTSKCFFLRFSLFFYILFKILIILSPISIDYQSLVMYYTIFKSVNISNNNNNNNKFVTCWTAYMRKRSKKKKNTFITVEGFSTASVKRLSNNFELTKRRKRKYSGICIKLHSELHYLTSCSYVK